MYDFCRMIIFFLKRTFYMVMSSNVLKLITNAFVYNQSDTFVNI